MMELFQKLNTIFTQIKENCKSLDSNSFDSNKNKIDNNFR